jgi:hypothetical protein
VLVSTIYMIPLEDIDAHRKIDGTGQQGGQRRRPFCRPLE